ncbi:hypothetical protein K438DRAFT_1494664, partial [Mycena galopus ATCC 62051]
GRLTPKEYKQLYMSRVDCHLIHGCEISPDCDDVHVKQLCDIQVSFLRQILNLHSHSLIAPLFTETGIMPLRFRRYLVLLSYLQYLLNLEQTHFTRASLDSSVQLAAHRKKSWFGDVCKAASKMPFHCPPPDMRNASSKSIEVYAKLVVKSALSWLQHQIESTDKLYLIQGRVEPQKDKPPEVITLFLRHYLFMVKTQTYREALTHHCTSILLSTHLLAVEKLRHVDHAKPKVSREQRLCRFCFRSVETPEHALLECISSNALLDLRR